MKHTIQKEPILIGEGAKVWPYDLATENGDFSLAIVKVSDKGHGKTMNTVCDRAYYVISGEGEFIIDEEIIMASVGELISIPKNTKYDFRATGKTDFELLLVQVPIFAPEAEVSF